MNLLLYIQALNEYKFNYSNPTLLRIKSEFPTFSIIDIDNFSEGDTLNYCIQALKEAKTITIVFDGDEKASISNFGSIIRNLGNKPPIAICTLTAHRTWMSYVAKIPGVKPTSILDLRIFLHETKLI